EGFDPPFIDLQMYDRTVANVGPPARQAIRKVAVTLQVRTPRLAPEGRGDGWALDVDGADRLPFFGPFSDFPRGRGASLSHGNVRPKSVIPTHRSVLA